MEKAILNKMELITSLLSRTVYLPGEVCGASPSKLTYLNLALHSTRKYNFSGLLRFL
jgi:hypothetical protein